MGITITEVIPGTSAFPRKRPGDDYQHLERVLQGPSSQPAGGGEHGSVVGICCCVHFQISQASHHSLYLGETEAWGLSGDAKYTAHVPTPSPVLQSQPHEPAGRCKTRRTPPNLLLLCASGVFSSLFAFCQLILLISKQHGLLLHFTCNAGLCSLPGFAEEQNSPQCPSASLCPPWCVGCMNLLCVPSVTFWSSDCTSPWFIYSIARDLT